MSMKSSRQFLLFSAIGAIGTGGHYACLIILVQCQLASPVVATTLGFAVGAAINYILNYRITFDSDKQHREALTKFLIVAAAGAVLNAGIMSAGLKIVDIHYLLIQLLATGIVLILNFSANKYWTFA